MTPIRTLTLTLLATALAACSSAPMRNAQLDDARSAFRQVQADGQTPALAPTEMRRAADALARAEAALANREGAAQTDHLACQCRERQASAGLAHPRGGRGRSRCCRGPPGCGQLAATAGGLTPASRLVAAAGGQRRIEGYTDSTGSDDANQMLSGQRADAAMAALVGLGVDCQQLASQGYGETHPVADNGHAVGRQVNRRVEIVLSDDSGVITPR